MKWFLSDVHIDHDVLLPVRRGVMGDHPFFKDINAWQTFIIGQINSTINRGDILYLLGDFSFRHAGKFRSQLKSGVQYFLIKGNHDPSWKACEEVWGQGMVKDTMDIQICDARCFLSHYPHAYWPASHRESYHLYGHCMDMQTEILTKRGWKTRYELFIGEEIYSMDEHGNLVDDTVNDIIEILYSGDVYQFDSPSMSMCFTDKHRCVSFNNDDRMVFTEAKDFFQQSRPTVARCGHDWTSSVDLTDAELKLLILIAADGSIKTETNLCRIRVSKQYKKDYIEYVLKNNGIIFKTKNKKNYTSFNFYIPENILQYKIKGLDPKLAFVKRSQFEAILEAYGHSDGCFTDSGGVIIYSAKEEEIDILQHAAVTNGCGATKYSREGTGFTKNIQYQLSVSKDKTRVDITNLKNRFNSRRVDNQKFWCIKCNNGNFLMRRNGKVVLTGNCHDQREETLDAIWPERRSTEVSPETIYRIWKEIRPVSEIEIFDLLSKRKGHDDVEFYEKKSGVIKPKRER